MSNNPLKILYEDNHIIAVVKPAGILSQGDLSGQSSMYGKVKEYLKEKYQKPGNAFVGIVQRLDRPVFGILLFAKTSKGASRLSEQFRNKTVEKTYQAIVLGKPSQSRGVLKNLLGKDEKLLKAKEYLDGREAILHYKLLKSPDSKAMRDPASPPNAGHRDNDAYSLLELQIEGGQFHQIRAQLSLAGMPILGDVKYGGQAVNLKWKESQAIALCATGISFQAATEEKRVSLEIDIPAEWNAYLSTE